MSAWVFAMLLCWNGECTQGVSHEVFETEEACQKAASAAMAKAPETFRKTWEKHELGPEVPQLMVGVRCLPAAGVKSG